MLVKRFEDLDAWKAAYELVLAVYRVTASYPKEEVFGITSQLRRSASSVGANLAEGFGRRSGKEFCRFVQIANGSLQETRYFLLLSRDLAYLEAEAFGELAALADRVGALLGGLERALKKAAGR